MGKSTAGGLFTLCGIFLAIGSKSECLKAGCLNSECLKAGMH
jgi:hypothetical protein